MSDNDQRVDRRELLQLLGAGSVASVAGCTGGVPGVGGGGSGSNFLEAQKKLNLSQNLRERRLATEKEWPMKKREDAPKSGATSWTGTETFKSAPWSPPDGWKDTPAGEVNELKIINHGAANMKYDPATLATHEIFQKRTGIKLTPIELGVDKANQKEQAILNAQKKTPTLMAVNGPLVPLFVKQGYLAPVDSLYPSEDVWDMYIPALQSVTQWELDQSREGAHEYGFPNIAEASLGHLRPDLMKQQGLDPSKFQGEWSWDLLEKAMKAFESTNKYAFAFYAGSPTYLSYSFRELVYQQGGRLVKDNGDVNFTSNTAIEAVRRMRKWYKKGWVPGDVVTYGEGDLVDLFLSGQLAFVTGFTDFVPQALKKFEANKQYTPVLPPKAIDGPNPKQASLIDPNATGINPFADTAHKMAAMLYGDLRLSYTSQWWEFTYEGNISFMDKVYGDAETGGFVKFGNLYGKAIENGVVELFPQMQAVFQRMATPIQEAIVGNKEPAKAMEGIQKWIDQNVNTEGQ